MHVWGDNSDLHLSGALDVHSAADVRSRVHEAIDGGEGDFVLDVSGVDALDATGLGLLVAIHRRAGRRERRFILRGVTPAVHRVLVITRLNRILILQPVAA
ncbi:STAS domain-containing protein [Yinghuangia sp. ASG 101]|uniref:STAS domain-containing protein n=1 Tax=Yinghuangia sp. ASG 101 TaxID=2896848 RepID=UPI001E5DDE5B|nr:STAS domain-containing protein [Yinghuangia sp. ASG 101]UGQ14250.1 STAS domain-containing protein [Yinghuangia sp. ASG 101]